MEKKYKVFYQGSLYGHFGRDRAGKEIEINKSFLWGGESWLVPSVYICGKGLVADILKSVSVEDFRAFAEKFGLDEADDPENFSPQRLAKAEAENPLGGGIYVTAKINSRESSMEFSSSDCWNPLFPDGGGSEPLLEKYGLDKSFCWQITRVSIPWRGRKPKKISSLSLRLRADRLRVSDMHFKANRPGDKTEFINPVTGKKHTLTVTAVERQKFSKLLHIGGKEPPLCTIMNYDISPKIPRDEISVNDRSKPEKPRGILAPRGKAASAIGIIGGADGPTVIVTSSASGRTACSSMHFEPEYEPDWCMTFYDKPREDIEVELI